ncbi:MAG: polysaccharide deacetylase family protein [Rhodospirillaceae bacterium]|nr:polysaccharide deacetylase family protein [Rhodospirillaceae bacterium]
MRFFKFHAPLSVAGPALVTSLVTGLVTGLVAGLTMGALPSFASAGEAAASAVMYHRFGEDDYPSTNIKIEQFEQHLQELKAGGYNVMALDEIVTAIINGSELPEKTTAITIDDAYLSVYTEAFPRLKKFGFPFTVFVATDAVDRADAGAYKRYMTWAQLKELEAHPLASIGSQTASHLHMIDATSLINRRDLERSQARFEEKLGIKPNIIAYPYGEFSSDVINIVRDMGFIAGFGQHSGAFGPNDNIYTLPRFAMNEDYGDIARFKTAASAMPITVEDMLPDDTVIAGEDNPPALGFSLVNGPKGGVNCFSSHEGKLQTERLGESRIEVRMEQAMPKGRTRLNCTAPGPDGRWYWMGRLFYVKE